MKKKLLIIFATVLSFNCYSQIIFEKGYYLNNSDEKIECLIKNVQWYNNPTKFTYKLTENTNEKETSIKEVKEFGIYNDSKYIRSTVNIDRSGEGITNLTSQKDPIFTNETLFLSVLVEGKATLYFYKEDGLEKYFYKTESNPIEQLINKNYLTTPHNSIASNKKYLVQLWNDLKCPEVTMKMVEKTEYDTDDLTAFFTKYNQCNNSQTTVFEKKTSWDWVNLSIRPGINSSSLSIKNINNPYLNTIDFKNQISVRLGIECEIVLPFNKNKWAIVLEPTYMYYKSKVNYYNGVTREATVDYEAIEFPLGVRHYFFLNNDSKIFINGFLVPEFNFSSTIKLSDNSDVFDIDVSPTLALGIGYKFKNKFSIEYRYTTNKNLLNRYDGIPMAKFMNSSLILGYTLF